jgi:hypothetical protein
LQAKTSPHEKPLVVYAAAGNETGLGVLTDLKSPDR